MVGYFILGCFFVYWSQVRVPYSCVVEELVDSVFVAHYTNWFFSEVFWVIYVVRVPIFVVCVVCSDFPDASFRL